MQSHHLCFGLNKLDLGNVLVQRSLCLLLFTQRNRFLAAFATERVAMSGLLWG